MNSRGWAVGAWASAAVIVATTAWGQQPDPAKVELRTFALGGNIHVIEGGDGGNIAASVGEDGIVLVDDHYKPLTPKLKAALARLSPRPVRFVLNTHWHDDHTGGNEGLAREGALIIAHENVRKRLSVEQVIEAFRTRYPPMPPVALPVVVFREDVTLHVNGDEVAVFHAPTAHTDGDAVVHFKQANVIHMGDIFFNRMYPFVDVGTGGSIDGMIAACDRALGLSDAKTRIIPGHGPVGGTAELAAYRAMMAVIRARVGALVVAGKSLGEIQAAGVTREYDAEWSGGFFKPEEFVAMVHGDLARR
jgi:cyclase